MNTQLLKKVPLIAGYCGLIMQFSSSSGSPERQEELLNMMTGVIEGGGKFVPPCMLEEFEDPICNLTLQLPRAERFDNVIPVREAGKHRRRLEWCPDKHTWCYQPFNPKFTRVDGDRVMLVIREAA